MKSGVVVRANARHPFLTVSENGVEEWRQLQDLKPGDAIVRAMRPGEACEESSVRLTVARAHPKSSAPHLSTWPVGLDEVLEVVEAGIEDVFDLQVDGTENFIANGLAAHNTRWHEDDLVGRILDDKEIGAGWEVLELPALVTEDDLPDPIGRSVDDALWPVRFPTGELEGIKRTVGPYIWSALYQGKPAPPEGNLFKRGGMRYWKPVGSDGEVLYNLGGGRIVNPVDCFRMSILDPAVTTKTENDPTVIGTWDLADRGDMILRSHRRVRVEGPDLIPLLWEVYREQSPALLGIESTAFQLTVFQQAKRDGLPVIELKADRDKVSRALLASGKHAAGQIWFEEDADYLPALELEMLKFPRARHDDQVDMVAYAALEANKRSFDWDAAYGIKECDSCGQKYLLEQKHEDRCPKCGAED